MSALAVEPGINGVEPRPPGTLTRERAASKAERERRRALVSVMVVRKRTLAEMQAALADARPGIFVSIQTISNDRQLVLEAWRAESHASIDHHVTKELAMLDAIADANLDGALLGDAVALSAVFGAHDRKAKLLGLAAPARVEVSGPGGAAIEVVDPGALRARGAALLAHVAGSSVIDASSKVRELTE